MEQAEQLNNSSVSLLFTLKGPCHLRLSFSMLKSYVHWSLGHASFPLKRNKEEEIEDFPKILRIVCV